MSVWWSGKEQSEHNSIRNQGTGQGSVQEGSSNGGGGGEHKFEKSLRELEAKGEGNTAAAQVLKDYLSGIPDVRREKLGLGPSTPPPTMEEQYEQEAFGLSEWEKIQKLASLEAGDPFDPENRYAKSFAGQEFLKGWKGFDEEELKKEWINKFGLPSILTTPTSRSDLYGSDPTKTTLRTDEYGQEIGGEYIYSGLGKELMGQLEGATSRGLPADFDYGTAKDAYWGERTVQDQAGTDQSAMATWPSDGGGGGGGGGGYGPQPGYKPEQMVNFYTPQANLQQAMVNVHQTPTVFKKRGGIVSLLELR